MRAIFTAAVLVAAGAYGQNTSGQDTSGQDTSGQNKCDRACLEGFVDQYLRAAVAHNGTRLPLPKGVKYTENGQRLEITDGLWNTMTAKGTYRLFVDDVQAGQVAFIGTIREADTPAMIAVRLRVQNRQVSEIETFVVRNMNAAKNLEEKWKAPHPVYMEAVPAAERMSRADLISTANMYFTGMQQNDGKGVYPFAEDCERLENGNQSTNAPLAEGKQRPDPKTASNYSAAWSCKEQFESGLLHFVTRIRDRRFVAVDQERGLVFSFAFFDHAAGKTRTFQTPDGRTVTAGPVRPWTWELAEMFKIEKGKIRRIEAILEQVPYGMGSGWSGWEDQMSSRAR
jgi:hypothetical protein